MPGVPVAWVEEAPGLATTRRRRRCGPTFRIRPNLRGTAFARPDSDTRKINLKDLDRFHTAHENKDQG